jgi:hypothetical protein
MQLGLRRLVKTTGFKLGKHKSQSKEPPLFLLLLPPRPAPEPKQQAQINSKRETLRQTGRGDE